MDMFGIGAAVQGMMHTYIQSSRRTGRTMSLVQNVKNGDRIVFVNIEEAERVKRLCLERGIEIKCSVVDPKDPGHLFQSPPSDGRTIFDHGWVEEFYLHKMKEVKENIDFFEKQSSGYGEAHRETKRAAQEIIRWRG